MCSERALDVLRTAAYLGLFAGAIAFVSSFAVYFSAPSRLVNRYLSIVLFLEGAALMLGPSTGVIRADWWIRGGNAAAGAAFTPAPWFYLLFMGQALRTPMTRWMASRRGQAFLWSGAGATVLLVAWAVTQHSFNEPIGTTPMFILQVGLYLFVSVFGLVAAFSAYRRATRSLVARARAKAYLVAFASRDVGWLIVMVGVVGMTYGGDVFRVFILGLSLGAFVFVVALNYGIFRFHLLNLDYGIRITLSRGTLAGFYVAAFLIVSKLAENGLNTQFGWVWGSVAAGLLLFAVAPLQQLAERFTAAFVPHARPLAQMSARERLDIYRNQLEVAWEDGQLSKKERRMLEVSRRRLGVDERDATRLERTVTSG